MYKIISSTILISAISFSTLFAQETSHVTMTKAQLVSLIQTLKLEKQLIMQQQQTPFIEKQQTSLIEKKETIVKKPTETNNKMEVDILIAKIESLELQLQQLSNTNKAKSATIISAEKTNQDAKIIMLEKRLAALEQQQLLSTEQRQVPVASNPNQIIILKESSPAVAREKPKAEVKKAKPIVAPEKVVAVKKVPTINQDSLEIRKLYVKLDSLNQKVSAQKTEKVVVKEPVKDYQNEIDALTKQLQQLESDKANKIKNELTQYEQLVHLFGNQNHKFLFANNSASVPSSYDVELDLIAKELRSIEKLDIVLKGFASSKGNPIYNEKLAQQRAQNVKKILIKKGVHPSRMAVVNHGVDYDNNENEARRVEIIYVVRK